MILSPGGKQKLFHKVFIMSMTTIPDLPTATTADDTDLILLRQPGSALGVDKKVTVAKVRTLNLAGLSTLPTGETPVASDLMLVQRGTANYQVAFQHVGFIKGVKMWFYHNLANEVSPNGWAIFTAGDTLLAVKGGSTYTVGGAELGLWQQSGYKLQITDIPNHAHWINTGSNQSNSNARYMHGAKDNFDTVPKYSNFAGKGMIGALNDNATHDNYGDCNEHNHGDTWRPKAAVGLIMVKL